MRTTSQRVLMLGLLGFFSFAMPARGLGQSRFQMAPAEQRLVYLTNQERAKANLPPLSPNPALFQAARAHSANMAKQGKMAHVLDGKDPAQRAREAGYTYLWLGENVAYGYPTLVGVMHGWMNSPGHRQNILSPNFTEIGVGMAVDARGVPYYTQVFGRPAPHFFGR